MMKRSLLYILCLTNLNLLSQEICSDNTIPKQEYATIEQNKYLKDTLVEYSSKLFFYSDTAFYNSKGLLFTDFSNKYFFDFDTANNLNTMSISSDSTVTSIRFYADKKHITLERESRSKIVVAGYNLEGYPTYYYDCDFSKDNSCYELLYESYRIGIPTFRLEYVPLCRLNCDSVKLYPDGILKARKIMSKRIYYDKNGCAELQYLSINPSNRGEVYDLEMCDSTSHLSRCRMKK